MPVPFGFSLGDFIATVQLFKDIGVALRDTGGASDDYQKTLRNLETIEIILSCIGNLQSSTADLPQINAVRAQALLIEHELRKFLKTIERYEPRLGSSARKGFHHGTVAKVMWSQNETKKVHELCRNVEIQLNSIHLLLELNNHDATSKLYLVQRATQDLLMRTSSDNIRRFEAHNAEARSAWNSLRQADQAIEDQLIDCSRLLTDRIGGLEAKLNRTMINRSLRQRRNMSSQIKSLQADMTLQLSDVDQRNVHFMRNMSSQMPTTEDFQELKNLLATCLPVLATSTPPHVFQDHTARVMLTLTIPQLSISASDIRTLLNSFSAEVIVILRIIFASFVLTLRNLLIMLPQLVLLHRILRRIPQTISLILNDNITFEDALGRTQSLQFQQFRNWPVFEASLRCTFDTLPGMRKVLAGEYVLTSPSHAGNLNALNWSVTIRPGSTVQMSVYFSNISTSASRCPKGCSAEAKLNDAQPQMSYEYICLECGLLFSLSRPGAFPTQRRLRRREEGHSLEEESSSGTQGRLGLRLRMPDHEISDGPDHPLVVADQEDTQDGLAHFKRVQLLEAPPDAPIHMTNTKSTQSVAALPQELVESLGSGAQILADYLAELEKAENTSHRPATPNLVRCMTCECAIQPWWIERHSALCIKDSDALIPVLETQKALAELRDKLVVVLDALTEMSRFGTPRTAKPLQTSYQGLRIPLKQPVYRPLQRVVELIIDLCDTALEIEPLSADRTGAENSRISQILLWQGTSSLDSEPGVAALCTDTESLARKKVDLVMKYWTIAEQSERVRKYCMARVKECMAKATHAGDAS